MLYQEQSEGCGHWSIVKYIEFQIPEKYDSMGETISHRSKFIFNEDIVQHIREGEVLQSFTTEINASFPNQAVYNQIQRQEK